VGHRGRNLVSSPRLLGPGQAGSMVPPPVVLIARLRRLTCVGGQVRYRGELSSRGTSSTITGTWLIGAASDAFEIEVTEAEA
jgi:hypothetical protein